MWSDWLVFCDCGFHSVCPLMEKDKRLMEASWWERLTEGESEVGQSCLTVCDPVHCSPPGSSIHGVLQARILEWVAVSFSRGSSQPRNRTHVSHIAGRRFNLWATREAHIIWVTFGNYVFSYSVCYFCRVILISFIFLEGICFLWVFSLIGINLFTISYMFNLCSISNCVLLAF